MIHLRPLAAAFVLAAALPPNASRAQSEPAGHWAERKCALYARAWRFMVPDTASAGASADFIAENEAFIGAGCSGRRVCPRTDRDRALADQLAIMAVAEGMAGSFLPFSCDE